MLSKTLDGCFRKARWSLASIITWYSIRKMSGLLLLTKQSNIAPRNYENILKTASELVNKTLYVYLQFGDSSHAVNQQEYRDYYRNLISKLYSYESCAELDCRILLSHLKRDSDFTYQNFADQRIKYVFTDVDNNKLNEQYLQKIFKLNSSNNVKVVNIPNQEAPVVDLDKRNGNVFDYSVLGGTFDQFHAGHKVLLSEAVMLTNKRLTIGVSDASMTKGKVLSELVQSLSYRIDIVKNFLIDIDSTVAYNVVPLSDPFGPSITESDLQCLIVSEETYKGGLKVNEERAKKSLSNLHIHSIQLVPDQLINDKVSSTFERQRNLGRLMNIPKKTKNNFVYPYLIGLTGGIASGKTSIANRLKSLGAHVIDCDKLGHLCYLKGSSAFHSIIETFGKDVIDASTGEINRKVLGSKVFSNPDYLSKLNKIVWPEIAKVVKKEIENIKASPNFKCLSVIVVDAAVLLEAGWDQFVDQVWVSIIPKEVAVQRIVERDGIDESDAVHRVEVQLSNADRIKKANAVFCTLWEPEVTQKQVERAWTELHDFFEKDNEMKE